MINKKVKVNNQIGTIIKTQGTYGLIKFEHGQYVYNLNSFKQEDFI